MDRNWRADFETAMGEAFAEVVCPPIPFALASPHECCEVIWEVVGADVTPNVLAVLSGAELAGLAARFGSYFEAQPPSVAQVKEATARTLARWPAASG